MSKMKAGGVQRGLSIRVNTDRCGRCGKAHAGQVVSRDRLGLFVVCQETGERMRLTVLERVVDGARVPEMRNLLYPTEWKMGQNS